MHLPIRFCFRPPIRQYAVLTKHLCVVMGLSFCLAATAAPYRPTDPNLVLEQLPRYFPQPQAFDRGMVRDEATELAQIQQLLDYAYLQGDPRALGQATARLQRQPAAADDVVRLMLRAQAAQANHDFAQARQLLERVKQQQPDNTDVHLQLATIELVAGNFAQAQRHCEQVRSLDALVLRLICVAQVEAMTGRLQATASKLKGIIPLLYSLTPSQQLWVLLLQADIALRLNDANLHAQVAARLPTDNIPALMARADWLMAQQQWQVVYDLLRPHTRHDGLMIRWVESQRRLRQPEVARSQQLLAERIAQWRQRDDQAHYREQAAYALHAESAEQSLRLARQNWLTQRETADFVIYATAALRSQSQADIKTLLDWTTLTGFEYPIVTQRLKAAQSRIQERTQ